MSKKDTIKIGQSKLEVLRGSENIRPWKFNLNSVFAIEGFAACLLPSTDQNVCKVATTLTKAYHYMRLSVAPHIVPHIEECESAYEIYEKCLSLFEGKGLVTKKSLRSKLENTDLEDCESMEDYLNIMTETRNHLASIGQVMEDDQFISAISCGLPKEFNPLIMAMDNENLTSEKLMSKLLEYSVKITTESGDRVAFYTGARRKNSNQNRGSNNEAQPPRRRCFNCDSTRHLRAQCDQEPQQSNERSPQSRESNNKNVQNKQTSSEATGNSNGTSKNTKTAWIITALSAQSSTKSSETEFAFDSGASNHCVNDKSLLVNQRVENNLIVATADNTKIKIEIKGDIELELEGYGSVVIHDVMYTPTIDTNLISIGQICAKGGKAVFEKKELKIFNPDGALMVTSKLQNGIYRLKAKVKKNHGSCLLVKKSTSEGCNVKGLSDPSSKVLKDKINNFDLATPNDDGRKAQNEVLYSESSSSDDDYCENSEEEHNNNSVISISSSDDDLKDVDPKLKITSTEEVSGNKEKVAETKKVSESSDDSQEVSKNQTVIEIIDSSPEVSTELKSGDTMRETVNVNEPTDDKTLKATKSPTKEKAHKSRVLQLHANLAMSVNCGKLASKIPIKATKDQAKVLDSSQRDGWKKPRQKKFNFIARVNRLTVNRKPRNFKAILTKVNLLTKSFSHTGQVGLKMSSSKHRAKTSAAAMTSTGSFRTTSA